MTVFTTYKMTIKFTYYISLLSQVKIELGKGDRVCVCVWVCVSMGDSEGL